MKALCDANFPFEKFIDQIEEAIIISDAAGTPYSPCQIVIATYNVLHQTWVFEDKYKVWWKKLENECTWAIMKQEFGNAHHNMLVNPTTATIAG